MSLKTVEINITGIVQGVGFRPFLFNLARNHNLKGFILNRGNAGVRLVLQGFKENIDEFIESIKGQSVVRCILVPNVKHFIVINAR